MRRRGQSIQELFSNVAFPRLLWYLRGKGFLLEVFLCLSLLRLFYPPILPIWNGIFTTSKRSGADWVHVDVMDGIFVPNISIGIPVVKALRPVTSLPLDVHLMIDRPIRYAEEFIKAGADWLTIHLESDQPQNTLACLDKIRAMGCKAAISLKPKTPAEAAIPYLAKCGMVLVMTVEPGFGAQKFMADMMPKVKKIRQMLDEVNPACIIEVDGGVDAVTYRTCRENGAEALVTGSAYFKAADRAAFVKTLRA